MKDGDGREGARPRTPDTREKSTAPRHLRVFLSSPADVAEERKIAREVLERLPRDPWVKGEVTIEVVSWDDPDAPVPMLAGLTPQQAVDQGLPMPSACDLTVAILWGRMGTPLTSPTKPDGSPYLSGTEYELETAHAAGKPVLVYRRTARFLVDVDDPDLDAKRKQKQLVEQFFARFQNDDGSLAGGYHRYEDVADFRQQFEAHAKALVRQILERESSDASRRPRARNRKGKDAVPPRVPQEYREWLQTRCASVELLGLRLKQGQAVRINNVYVPLTTAHGRDMQDARGRKRPRPGGDEDPADQLLLDRVGESSVYISGDPGSGKSTFCRWLAWVACEGAVPPSEDDAPDAYRERLAPALGNRLPVLVPLRQFWNRLQEQPRAALGPTRSLESAVAQWLEDGNAPGVSAALVRAHVEQGTALFIFDGIDEVPPAPRAALVEVLAESPLRWIASGNRVVVTSRPYALSDAEIARLGLPHAPIRPVPVELQWLLVRRWFRILSESPEAADASATEMLRQVREQAWLSPLTENPLLLTGMCIVFGDGKGLPEDKYELYDRVADAVLHNRIPDRLRLQLVRARLAVVAHGMHTGEGLSESRATPQAVVTDREIESMLRAYQVRSAWTEQDVQEVGAARDELVTQTGVLLPRGEHQASFLHLSFQEFLAAQRLADVEADTIRDVFLHRSRSPEWRNTLSFLFGSLLATSTTPERAVRLLTDLIGRMEAGAIGLVLVVADAMEILLRRRLRLPAPVEQGARATCLAAMRGDAPARERCLVGSALGRIGDPRFSPEMWFLPDEPLLGFVEVPAGPFTMGSDKQHDTMAYDDEMPQHQVTLPSYYIARWPVTVAQFKAFVEAPDNDGFGPGDPDCVKGVRNHPVVNVTWHEAQAYCRWLTGRLRGSDRTPDPLRRLLRGEEGSGWCITLPSEAEWEKAARGSDGRIYPWGNQFDPNRCNGLEAAVGSVSAVGAFPGGASPFGVEDLAGNVWEWTDSLWGTDARRPAHGYPYDPDDAAREDVNAPDNVLRVLRGGSFLNSADSLRAALRFWDSAVNRDDFVGFRLVSSRLRS